MARGDVPRAVCGERGRRGEVSAGVRRVGGVHARDVARAGVLVAVAPEQAEVLAPPVAEESARHQGVSLLVTVTAVRDPFVVSCVTENSVVELSGCLNVT